MTDSNPTAPDRKGERKRLRETLNILGALGFWIALAGGAWLCFGI